MIFDKPPLVELIAELRWGIPGMVSLSGGTDRVVSHESLPITPSNRVEELFMQFGAKVAADGYSRFERTVPSGFPLMPFQPVYRYRKNAPEDGTSLYQLGPGLFTANITPPYRSWEQFRPVVELGIKNLLACRKEKESEEPFSTILLRYIDAFGSDYTLGESPINFLTEKLGFGIKLPLSIEELADKSAQVRPALQFGVPLKGGFFMNIAAGEGFTDGSPAIIMDTTVSTTSMTESSLDGVMAVFDQAHLIIRGAFLEMTKPISTLMQPTTGGN